MAIPLSKSPSGRFFGNRAANVQVDIFLDVQCPYSAKSWPVIKELMDHYGSDKIGLSIHLMTLSNHRQSWDATLALTGLAGDDDAQYYAFLGFLYSQQERFFNGAFADKSHNDLHALLGTLGEEFNGTPPAKMAELLADNGVYYAAKEPGRYAALRGVWSTPTIFINDSEQFGLGSSSTLDDWRAVVDPLLA